MQNNMKAMDSYTVFVEAGRRAFRVRQCNAGIALGIAA